MIAAAGQSWPPFALVAGMLLIGSIADGDGLFEAAGGHLAAIRLGPRPLLLALLALVAVVTATLNLDTSVVFMTPVPCCSHSRSPWARSPGAGTCPRRWSPRAVPWTTAATSALASILLNNLPAAVLLSSQRPTHPTALLVGLDLGPNLAVTGSLSAILWLRAARRSAPTRPSSPTPASACRSSR